MLFAAEPDLAGIFAADHPQSEAEVVADSELIRQPTDAMSALRFVARHHIGESQAFQR